MSSSNDQLGNKYSIKNATSYGGHPGYNQNTGIYSYGSGQDYESRSTATNTSASLRESSYTTESSSFGTNGKSFASQYATDPNVSYNQQSFTSTGSYFNLPYGTATFLESENGPDNPSTGSVAQQLSNASPIALHPKISDNKNSTTYMQSNSQINTTTTFSVDAETRDVPQTSHGSTIHLPQQSTDNITTQSNALLSNIDLLSGLNVTISDLTISAPQLQQ